MISHSSLFEELSLVEAVREERCSPEVAALLIAKDARPSLDLAHELSRIDALAEGLGASGPGASALGAAALASASPREQARALAAHLFERHGFHGNEDDYHDPRNSYLDAVLSRRTGIPIALSVVLLAVGRRVGVHVEGIGFPGHFLARVGGAAGVLVDPFFGGRVLEPDAVRRLAARMLGPDVEVNETHLAPVGLRPLVVRILLNLKHAHERRADHGSALLACDRLVDLTDAAPLIRDRGLHALALGAHAQAAEDLATYLAREPEARDAAPVRSALARARGGTRASLA